MQNFHFSSHAPSNRRQRVFPRRFYINPSSPNVLFTESTSPKNLPIVVCLSIPNRLILDRLPLIVVPRRSLFFLLSNPAVLSSTAASFLSNPAVLSSTAASFQSNPAVLSSTAASSHSNPRPRRSSPMSRQSLVYSSISHLLSSTQRFLPSIRSRFSLHLSRHSRQIMLPKRGLFHFVPLTLVVFTFCKRNASSNLLLSSLHSNPSSFRLAASTPLLSTTPRVYVYSPSHTSTPDSPTCPSAPGVSTPGVTATALRLIYSRPLVPPTLPYPPLPSLITEGRRERGGSVSTARGPRLVGRGIGDVAHACAASGIQAK
jgi:hypothetical protein